MPSLDVFSPWKKQGTIGFIFWTFVTFKMHRKGVMACSQDPTTNSGTPIWIYNLYLVHSFRIGLKKSWWIRNGSFRIGCWIWWCKISEEEFYISVQKQRSMIFRVVFLFFNQSVLDVHQYLFLVKNSWTFLSSVQPVHVHFRCNFGKKILVL